MAVYHRMTDANSGAERPPLQLWLLGGFSVAWQGHAVKGFESNKARALLCYLVVEERPLRREHLAGLFWGVLSEERARGNLSRVLTNLRNLVPGSLLSDRWTVQFDSRRPYWLDVVAFENHYRAASQDGVIDTAFDDLTAAAELYRGSFLEAFSLRGCPIFEEWLSLQRERLRGMALWVLDGLINLHLQRGEFTLGINYAQRSLAMEPWREAPYRQMMLMLALQGERERALRQYEICCRILDGDLDVAPTEKTQELYRRILDGDVIADHVDAFPSELLSQDEQWLLKFAAVIGEPFTLSFLARVAGRSEQELGEVLEAWEARRVVRCNCAGEYDFAYERMRASVYRRLPDELRKLLHGRVGQALIDAYAVPGGILEGQPVKIPDDVAAQVAYHFERSLDPRRAAPYLARGDGTDDTFISVGPANDHHGPVGG